MQSYTKLSRVPASLLRTGGGQLRAAVRGSARPLQKGGSKNSGHLSLGSGLMCGARELGVSTGASAALINFHP